MPYKDPETARAKAHERYLRNKHKRYYQPNITKRERNKLLMREWRKTNQPKNAANVKAWRERRWRQLGGERPDACEACGNKPQGKRGIMFDHCHKRGHFRGWLCNPCNTALGLLSDDPDRLRKLIAYLERTKTPRTRPQFVLPL
jgi:hypothetical protein